MALDSGFFGDAAAQTSEVFLVKTGETSEVLLGCCLAMTSQALVAQGSWLWLLPPRLILIESLPSTFLPHHHVVYHCPKSTYIYFLEVKPVFPPKVIPK